MAKKVKSCKKEAKTAVVKYDDDKQQESRAKRKGMMCNKSEDKNRAEQWI